MDHPTYNILLVEDSAGDAVLISEAFSECGYRCKLNIVGSTIEAERVLSTDQFNLILCDYGSDVAAGSEAIKRLRQLSHLTPIVVFSGYPDPRPAYQAGANAYVPKAGSLDDLYQRVRSIMQFWTSVAELPPPPQRFAN